MEGINLYLVCLAFVIQSEFIVVSSGLESFRNDKLLEHHHQLPRATLFPEKIDSNRPADNEIPNFLDSKHKRSTSNPAPPNVTLNTEDDINMYWTIPSTNIPKWLEYYNNTQSINASADNQTCAHVIVALENQLPAVDGIWVACQDPANPESCHDKMEPCHPQFNYDASHNVGDGSKFRTVKIHLSVHGFGIVRLTTGHFGREVNYAEQIPTCFDFSRRMDPFSRCDFIKINGTENEFTIVQSAYDGYINKEFKTFTVQLIARFKNDVALVDVVEATGLLLCDDGETVCTTIKPGPTGSPTTTKSSICQTTEERSSEISKATTELAPKISFITLDVDKDVEDGNNWEISSLNLRFLEYYNDFGSIWDQGNNLTASCANIMIEENLIDLNNDTQGLWISCLVSEQYEQQGKNELAVPPFILYTGSNILSITVDFYLIGNATIRLQVGNNCWDYSNTEISASSCQFIRIRQDGVFWRGFYWRNQTYEMATELKMELISRETGDVVIMDKVTVELSCDNGECLQLTTEVSNTVTYTTDLATSTDNACDSTSTDTEMSSTDDSVVTDTEKITSTTDGSNFTEITSPATNTTPTTTKIPGLSTTLTTPAPSSATLMTLKTQNLVIAAIVVISNFYR